MGLINQRAYRSIKNWSKCHICFEPVPAGLLPGYHEEYGWTVLECSGGGCGVHLVCEICTEAFGFVNVLRAHLVRCRTQLSEEDLVMIALR